MPAAFELVHVVLHKLWDTAKASTTMPVVFEPVHATGAWLRPARRCLLPQLVHAALYKPWATAKAGTERPVVVEPGHAALNKPWRASRAVSWAWS